MCHVRSGSVNSWTIATHDGSNAISWLGKLKGRPSHRSAYGIALGFASLHNRLVVYPPTAQRLIAREMGSPLMLHKGIGRINLVNARTRNSKKMPITRDLDLDLGSVHTAYLRASLIDLYVHAKFH